jgi:predicted esterase
VLERGMPRYFRRIAEGVLDEEDLIVRTDELADFIGAATAAYGIEPTQLIAVGYSNGANIAAALLLLRPGTLAGAALLRPMVPLRPAEPPDLAGIPAFIAAGRYDPLVPPAQSEALAELLRRYGAEVTLHWQNGDHNLGREELAAARAWLSEVPSARGRAGKDIAR